MDPGIDAKVGPVAVISSASEAVPREAPSFDEVYAQTFAVVWRTLQRLGVEPASLDDSAQQAFMIIHRRLADYRPEASLKAWVIGIAVRVASTSRRGARRRGEQVELMEDLVDAAPGPMEHTAKSEARRIVDTLLDGLEASQREVFVLAEMEQMSGPDISEALGVKLNTVYSRLRLAREAFDERLRAFRARSGER